MFVKFAPALVRGTGSGKRLQSRVFQSANEVGDRRGALVGDADDRRAADDAGGPSGECGADVRRFGDAEAEDRRRRACIGEAAGE